MYILDNLGVTTSPELTGIFGEAAEIHRLRKGEDRPLSRATLMYVCAVRSDETMKLLVANGFAMSKYRSSIGLQSPRMTPRPDISDIRVNDDVISALAYYRKQWQKRPVDAIGLAAAILGTADGEVRRHLENAGVNVPLAASAFATAIAEPLTRQSVWDGIWSADFVVPYATISKYEMEQGTLSVLAKAESIARHIDDAAAVVTTSILLLAALESGTSLSLAALATSVREILPDERFRDIRQQWLAHYRGAQIEGTTSKETFVTAHVVQLLEHARDLARRTTGVETIKPRHLLARLVTYTPPAGDNYLLGTLGISSLILRRALWRSIEERIDDDRIADRREPWRDALFGDGDDSRDAVTSYVSDQFKGTDALHFRRHVNAFATLIAAKNLNPPLSIGIFGEWGSGKSYFMDMLHDAIGDRAGSADDRFRNHIVRIKFNAWHYAESNLWASLVGHIFDEVFRFLKLDKATDDDLKKRRQALLVELDQATAERLEKEAYVETARTERDRAASMLEAERARSEGAGATLRALSSLSPWEFVDSDDKEIVAKALKQAGVESVAGDVRQVVAEAQRTGGRLRILWRWLLGGRPYWLRGALALVVLSVPLLRYSIGGGLLHDSLQKATAYVIWFGGVLTSVGAILIRLEKAHKVVDDILGKAKEKKEASLAGSVSVLAGAESSLTTAVEALSKANKKVQDAEDELANLSGGHRLRRFIEERVASDDYRKLLGVLATVRNDFEKLSTLMVDTTDAEAKLGSEYRIDRIVLFIDDLDRCPADRVVKVLQAVHLLLAFKLFVVVVGVDAQWVSRALKLHHGEQWHDAPVHVDHADTEGASRLPGFAARPEDYLEKIFQIPFWIQTMSVEQTQILLGDLVEISSADIPNDNERQDYESTGANFKEGRARLRRPIPPMTAGSNVFIVFANANSTGSATGGVCATNEPISFLAGAFNYDYKSADHSFSWHFGDGSTRKGRKVSHAYAASGTYTVSLTIANNFQNVTMGTHVTIVERSANEDPPVVLPPHLVDDQIDLAPSAANSGTEAFSSPDDTASDTEHEPVNLFAVERHESSFIQRLAGIIGRSPRATKRFVNTYRLIRATLGVSEAAKFLNVEDGEYRHAQLVLGIVVGAPTVALDIFERMQILPMMARLRDLAESMTAEPSGKDRSLERLEWTKAAAFLRELAEEDKCDLDLVRLRAQIRRVGRYSFQLGRS